MTERSHRWAVAVLCDLDEGDAVSFAAMSQLERLDAVRPLLTPDSGLVKATAVRGPICSECRVSWDDVHRERTPWPCPGRRPDALGGPLHDPTRSRPAPNRQQRRARRREETRKRPEADAVLAQINGAIAMGRNKDSA